MSKKVTGVAGGEAHTLALTGDGNVFSWGRGTFGRLGTGKDTDELSPVRISFGVAGRGEPKFVQVAAGAYHSLALQDDGTVWSWGYNICTFFDKFMDGQLGYSAENSLAPKVIEQFKELGTPNSLLTGPNVIQETTTLKVSSVKAGGMMSLAIDNLGALWMWGNCPKPRSTEEEEFSLVSSSSPLPVWDFHGRTVVKVACGNEHVVASVSASETFGGTNLLCYAWGNNNHGQLGLGDRKGRARPQAISAFEEDSPWSIYEIACGAFHTAILTHNNKSYDQEIESRVWTFGLGENGQLGHGSTTSTSLPKPVDGLPRETFLISLDCGLFHTSVVSGSGEVWSWGMVKGLGLCPDARFAGDDSGDALSPIRLRCSEMPGGLFPVPVQVACGAAHTVLVADDGGKLWAWGRGRSGVLGRGQFADSFVPAPLMWPASEAGSNAEQRKHESKSNFHPSGSATAVDKKDPPSLLHEKLELMERYAAVLHFSIFRKPLTQRSLPQSLLHDSQGFDLKRELENMISSADEDELARLQMFYEGMLSSVKDKIMERRIKEAVKDYFLSLSNSSGRRQP